MFQKVLIVEDLDSVNSAVQLMLRALHIPEVINTQYCDEAYLKIKKATLDQEPFDLIICDLNFKSDHRNERIQNGEDLIKIIKADLPDTKIIMNTVEDHPNIVKRIWRANLVDAYVVKDRNGMKNLEAAIKTLAEGSKFLSPNLKELISSSGITELSDYEISILNYISSGYSQDEIHEIFKTKNINPHSKSSIEKKLKELRESFEAKTNPHLISIVKDYHLI